MHSFYFLQGSCFNHGFPHGETLEKWVNNKRIHYEHQYFALLEHTLALTADPDNVKVEQTLCRQHITTDRVKEERIAELSITENKAIGGPLLVLSTRRLACGRPALAKSSAGYIVRFDYKLKNWCQPGKICSLVCP